MRKIPLLLLTLTLAGNALASPPEVAKGVSRLDDVLTHKRLRVCMAGDYMPFAHVNTEGTWEGIDVDLARSLGDTLRVPVHFVRSSWAGLTNDFLGKCDIAMGGISVTLDRLRHVAFSAPHLEDGKIPLIRCEDQERFADFAAIDRPDTRAVVNPGGTNERFARNHFKHAQLRVHGDNLSVFRELVEGRADVMVTDASEARWQSRLHPQLCPVQPDRPLEPLRKAFMLPRGDVAFKAYVDGWMGQLRHSGQYQRIVNRWLLPDRGGEG